jgi:hypothetical protein
MFYAGYHGAAGISKNTTNLLYEKLARGQCHVTVQFNLNREIIGPSFEVYWASKPFPSINYDA